MSELSSRANEVLEKQHSVDAITKNAIVVTVASATPVRTDSFSINKIRWVGATTAGHTVIVTDQLGNVKFASVATGANYVESETFDGEPFDGLVVPTLASGTIYIYV